MPLQAEQIADLVIAQQKSAITGRYLDLAQSYQKYFTQTFLKKKKTAWAYGLETEFLVMTTYYANILDTGPFQTDNPSHKDVLHKGSVSLKMITAAWDYDVLEKVFQSDSKRRIFDYLVARENAYKGAILEYIEHMFFNAPDGTEESPVLGLPFWLPKNPSAGDGAWQATNPPGFPQGRANIDSTAHTNWAHWGFSYDAISESDAIPKLRRAQIETEWDTLVPHADLVEAGGPDNVAVTTVRVVLAAEALNRARGDNFKNNLLPYTNMTMLDRTPLVPSRHLEAHDTSDPIYGIDWKTWQLLTAEGYDMKQHKPREMPLAHNWWYVPMDHAFQYACNDIRRNFCGCLRV